MAENELELVDQGAKKKKLIIIGAAAGLLLVLAVVAFFLLSGGDSGTPVTSEQADVETGAGPVVAQGSALYVQMPRPFVFNVAGANRDRLVQIRVQLMVRGDANQALAMRHIPLIEGTLLATFSTASADELITSTGKEQLKNKALIDLQTAMLDVVGSAVVAEVLFTGFVMQ